MQSNKIIIQTTQGYNFSVPATKIQDAVTVEGCEFTQAIERLRSMLSLLVARPPTLREPVRPDGRGLQCLALDAAAAARFDVAELRAGAPVVMPLPPILEEFLAVPFEQLQDWFEDLPEQKADQMRQHATDVRYILTGEGLEAPSFQLKHQRSRMQGKERRGRIWMRMVAALLSEEAPQLAKN